MLRNWKKLITFFVQLLEQDNKKIIEIQRWDVFNVEAKPQKKKKGKQEEKPYWNAFNLIPTIADFGNSAKEVYNRQLCNVIATSPTELEIIYQEWEASKVWMHIGLKKAKNYNGS